MPQITLNRAKLETLVKFCDTHDCKRWFLAKDQGAYVGASAGEKGNCIFYFAGCDPVKNPDDFYDQARYQFGGDDFGLHFDVQILRDMLKDATTKSMVVKVGKSKVSISQIR